MSNRFSRLLVFASLAAGAIGCQPKSRIREDPFLPGTGGVKRSADPVADARDDYRSKSNRDLAKGVSNSPATDDNYGRPSGRTGRDDSSYADRDSGRRNESGRGGPNSDFRPASSANDPLNNSDRPAPEKTAAIGNRAAAREAGYAQTEVAKNRNVQPRDDAEVDQAVHFEQIRRRLDKLGARNICLEPVDRASGEMAFRCEVPLPGSNDRVRVFEGRDANELKLMQAVAEAAEKWVDEKKTN